MIGIVIPTFDRVEVGYEQTVLNLRNQISKDFTAFIVNQGEPWPSFDRFWWSRNVWTIHVGWQSSGFARNIGMSLAIDLGCDYICFWDDDDEVHPEYLQKMSGELDRDKDVDVVASMTKCMGQILPIINCHTASRMIRASKIGSYRWDGKGPGQDQRFWNQMQLPTAYINEPLYTVHDNQTPGGHRAEAAAY